MSEVAAAGLVASAPATPRHPWPRVLAEILGCSAVLGLVVGWGWSRLAEEAIGRVEDGALFLSENEAARTFSDDGWLGVLAIAAGLLLGVAMAARHRGAGPVLPASLAAGGVLGSVVAWQSGVAFGPGDPGPVAGLADGAAVAVPYEIQATGVLLLWSLASVLMLLVIVALDRRDRHHVAAARDADPDADAAADA